jgi:hypothetical protein
MVMDGVRWRQQALAVVMASAGLGLSSGDVMAQKGVTPQVKLEAFDRSNFDRSTNEQYGRAT